jgi:hypothetical protein
LNHPARDRLLTLAFDRTALLGVLIDAAVSAIAATDRVMLLGVLIDAAVSAI